MKTLALFALVLTLLLAGCGKGKTTDTVSNKFTTLEEKKEFLERYVKFRRSYDDLEFHIAFIDGGTQKSGTGCAQAIKPPLTLQRAT